MTQDTGQNTRICIIGCGYIGRLVVSLIHKNKNPYQCVEITGVVLTPDSAEQLVTLSVIPFQANFDEPDTFHALPVSASLVYYFLPPPSRGEQDSRMSAFIRFLDGLSQQALPQRIVLLSTTGVYGDCNGEWVDEGRPVNPQTDRARRRLDAETTLGEWGRARRVEVIILRVPGIYGPGRLPEKRIRQGLPLLRPEDSPFSNRIHAQDLAQACVAAMARGRSGQVYNISDGHPGTMTDYFFRVADFLELQRPPVIGRNQVADELGEGMQSYLAESRRIDNSRMREELGVVLQYPDLDTGLSGCI